MLNRKPVRLSGSSLKAALALMELKETFERKRADIFAKYEAEMKEFTDANLSTLESYFRTIYSETNTSRQEGWAISENDGQILLVPIYPEIVVEAMMEQTNNQVH